VEAKRKWGGDCISVSQKVQILMTAGYPMSGKDLFAAADLCGIGRPWLAMRSARGAEVLGAT